MRATVPQTISQPRMINCTLKKKWWPPAGGTSCCVQALHSGGVGLWLKVLSQSTPRLCSRWRPSLRVHPCFPSSGILSHLLQSLQCVVGKIRCYRCRAINTPTVSGDTAATRSRLFYLPPTYCHLFAAKYFFSAFHIVYANVISAEQLVIII